MLYWKTFGNWQARQCSQQNTFATLLLFPLYRILSFPTSLRFCRLLFADHTRVSGTAPLIDGCSSIIVLFIFIINLQNYPTITGSVRWNRDHVRSARTCLFWSIYQWIDQWIRCLIFKRICFLEIHFWSTFTNFPFSCRNLTRMMSLCSRLRFSFLLHLFSEWHLMENCNSCELRDDDRIEAVFWLLIQCGVEC